MRAFLNELRRRKVLKIGIAYLVGAWLVMQLADVIFPAMRLPDWSVSLVLGILVVGFPLALVLSWVFDVTPSGVERTADISAEAAQEDEAAEHDATSPSIAVLPFADLSPDHDNEYFSDGLTEELLSVLSRAGGMRVASRTSSFAFKGRNPDISTISRQLNVGHVVEGSVRKSGNLLRISCQLIEAATDSHLWSDTYDRELDDVFAIQDEIATQIAGALRVQLAPSTLTRTRTENVRAYDLFLRGNGYFRRLGRANTYRAIEMYEQAVAIDASFDPAWARIAISHATLALLFLVNGDDRADAINAARAAAGKAIELAPDSAESRLAVGMVLNADGRPDEAEPEFAKAIDLDSQLHEAHYQYARAAYMQGRMNKAAELFERAIEIDPDDYRSSVLLISAYRRLGRPDLMKATATRGVALLEKHLEKHPHDADALALGTGALKQLGNLEKADLWAERALEADPDNESISYNIACYYSQTGNLDRAMDLIERCIHSNSWIRQDSDLDPLRDLPRFRKFVGSLE